MSDAVDSTLVVDVTETVEGVMAAIEQNGYRSVVVVDEHQRVVGTASDGDLRKALLAHRVLSTPVSQVMRRNCLKLAPEEIYQARALFEREHIFLIPVVDAQGRLLQVLKAY